MSLEAPISTEPKTKPKAVVPLFAVDGRTRLGRRITELQKLYSDAMGGELSPLQAEQVATAAQLTALAERARAQHVAGEVVLDDVVRCERVAALAVRRLGIRPEATGPRPMTLDEYLASKRAAAEAAQ